MNFSDPGRNGQIQKRFTTNSLVLLCATLVLAWTGNLVAAQQADTANDAVYITAGTVTTVADDIEAGAGGLAIDSNGNLYTADFGWSLGGRGKGGDKIFKVTPQGIVELFCRQMRGASGNTIDSEDNLYQSSIGSGVISKIDSSGTVSVFGKGQKNPVGIAIGDKGELYVCNCGGNTIQRISRTGESEEFCKSDLFKCPNGIARAKDGTLYVCNFGNGDVIKVSPEGKATRLATLPGNNNGHLTLFKDYLFVVARSDNRIYKIDLQGNVKYFVGDGVRGDKDGSADECSFSLPNSIVASPDGKYLYINETSPTSGDPRILGPTRIRRIELLVSVGGTPPIEKELVTASPDVAAKVQQARALLGQNDFAGAEKILRSLAQQSAELPGPSFLLGYTLHAQGKYEEAKELFEQTKSFPQVRTLSLYNLACIHSLQNEKDKAFERLDEAVQSGFQNFAQLKADSDFDNIKDDPRFKKLIEGKKQSQANSSNNDLFVEPSRVIHQWSGEAAGDQFGWTARRVGDLDGDKVIDFVATAPTYNKGAGKIYIYSSKTSEELFSVEGKAGYRLGNSSVGVGDINGDGVPDVIAGAPAAKGTGAAFVYSGKDGSQIHSIFGKTKAGQFGYEVSELGDLDGDDVPDFLVGEMTGTGEAKKSGRAIAYSGKSAEMIFELKGKRAGDGFGNAAACAKLPDGSHLLAIGAQNAGPNQRGEVFVYQIVDKQPKLRFKIEGDKNSVNLGQMFIAFPGDVDGDGIVDVYASDFSDKTKVRGGGKVVVHSGATGKQLLAFYGTNAGEGLGTSPSDAGDVDGDGIGDLAVGAWQNREGASSGGKIYLYSCKDGGKLLRTWTGKVAGETLGFDSCGIGDVDGDGHVDFLVTSAWSNVTGTKSGRVVIIAGEKY